MPQRPINPKVLEVRLDKFVELLSVEIEKMAVKKLAYTAAEAAQVLGVSGVPHLRPNPKERTRSRQAWPTFCLKMKLV